MRKVDGIIIINKPQWFTSFDVIAKLRKQLKTKKVGHTGTLDPMATGVLVVCIGKATPLVNILTSEDKVYRTTIKLGIETDTADLTGRITRYIKEDKIFESNDLNLKTLENQTKNVKYISDIAMINYNNNNVFSNEIKFDLDNNKIIDVIKGFIGKQDQIPPLYSSIKIDGKKLYEYARKGENVEIPSRKIEIYDIKDICYDGNNELSYTVHCSKGTYIRSLNEDIAKKLGLIGTTMHLERIKTGKFSIENAICINDVDESKIIPIEKLFDKKIVLEDSQEKMLLNGIEIESENENGIYNLYIGEKYYGLGEVKDKKLKRYIIL
ncbi:MAG: tRNA pseudouridine(55) synthase TruB [Clostridia bacterium]|nr:tRNA pseudouridine(55) synthase TruB [Clostridia bacterium]